jgi:hypothetical protein
MPRVRLSQQHNSRRHIPSGEKPIVARPEAFRPFVRAELDQWTKLIKEANITPE